MNILIVGSGKGSWIMRGQQLGEALGARVVLLTPTSADVDWADVVVLVKRGASPSVVALVRAAGKPLVWDALDFWRQPLENRLEAPAAHALLKAHLAGIKPTLMIGATEAQAQAADGVYLPHHSWHDLVPTRARRTVTTVAYQGGEVFLGRWAAIIEKACAARGWRFVINPDDLAEADLIVSFRDGVRDGWMCREWKSGVKAVNAIAAGRPFISQPSAAVAELKTCGSGVETEAHLTAAFDYWANWEYRTRAVEYCEQLAPAYRLPVVAARYHDILSTVAVPCR